MLKKLKKELVQLHLELPKNNLVMWTGGNVSARDAETGLVVIKASDPLRRHAARTHGGRGYRRQSSRR